MINELIAGVNIALGSTAAAACLAMDTNGDGLVSINELVAAVDAALSGCTALPTQTATSTARVTEPMNTPTPTDTAIQQATPNATPTATLPVGSADRVFTIEPGLQNASPAPPNVIPSRNQTRSGLFTNALSNGNAAITVGPGPLRIVMGTPDASGVASLNLAEDVDLAIQTLVPCLCMHLLANGSGGSIDCDGGTAYDTVAVREGNAGAFDWTATTGLGEPSGPGNANLLIMAHVQTVSDAAFECTAAQCATLTYTDPPTLLAFTTTTATAVQKQLSGGDLVLSDVGEPFDCANFGRSNSGGMLAAPAPMIIDPFGAFANVVRFGERLELPVGSAERVFTIEPGLQNASPAPPNVIPSRNQTRSGLFTNALSNGNAAITVGPGPLRIVMGTPDASGVASLNLAEDVDLAIQTLVPCLCMHLLADGSGGSIDCDGGTAYDTLAVREPNAVGFGWTATTGLGDPSAPGNANLLVKAQFQAVSDAAFDCTAAQCAALEYTDPPTLFAFTTTTATAIQKQVVGGDLVLSDVGEPFDCTTFATSNSGGMLAAPAPTIIDPFGAFANVFRFAEPFHAQSRVP